MGGFSDEGVDLVDTASSSSEVLSWTGRAKWVTGSVTVREDVEREAEGVGVRWPLEAGPGDADMVVGIETVDSRHVLFNVGYTVKPAVPPH